MSRGARQIGDELIRCPWPGITDPLYAAYHDTEWGVPIHDDRALFEKLALESFQSGLSWLTILKKRNNFRAAFDGFEIEAVARYDTRDLTRLMNDAGIVRNRRKIEATINNAEAVLRLRQSEGVSFAAFLWSFAPALGTLRTVATFDAVPAETDASRRLAKALKAHGFQHVGPTTLYAMMQAVGMVNDHVVGCHRHAPCAKLQSGSQIQSARRGKAARA